MRRGVAARERGAERNAEKGKRAESNEGANPAVGGNQRLTGGQFASNWELSAQRAINVVKLLIEEGIPPTRLAATGFGEYQPLEGGETPAAYARNRRIELRLTDR